MVKLHLLAGGFSSIGRTLYVIRGFRGFWYWVKWRQRAISLLLYSLKTHACDRYFTLNCTFISHRNTNPNPRIASTLGVQLPSGPQVSVLVSKQESAVEREFSPCSYCRRVRKRELTVPVVVMHFVSDFTECIPIQINIKTSKQIHTPPFPAHLLGWSVYFCIANLMYYFTYFDFLVSSIAISIYSLLDL